FAHRALHSFPHDALPIFSWVSRLLLEGVLLMVFIVWGCLPNSSYAAHGMRGDMPSPRSCRVFTSHPSAHQSGRRVPILPPRHDRSEEHTSELQSRGHLVC